VCNFVEDWGVLGFMRMELVMSACADQVQLLVPRGFFIINLHTLPNRQSIKCASPSVCQFLSLEIQNSYSSSVLLSTRWRRLVRFQNWGRGGGGFKL